MHPQLSIFFQQVPGRVSTSFVCLSEASKHISCFCLWMWACSTWDGAIQKKYRIMHACSAQLHCREVVMGFSIFFWLCDLTLTVQHAVSTYTNSFLPNLGGQDFSTRLLIHTSSFWSQDLFNSLSTLAVVCDSFMCDSSARRRNKGSYIAGLALAHLALARLPRSDVAHVAHVALSLQFSVAQIWMNRWTSYSVKINILLPGFEDKYTVTRMYIPFSR